MYFTFDWDEALRKDRIFREKKRKKRKKEERRKKIKTLVNHPNTSEKERKAGLLALEKLEHK